MKIILAIFLLLLIGCKNGKSKTGKKVLDFGSFSIETPVSWQKVKLQGIDSYVGRISIDAKDALDFNLGPYSNNLTEPEPQIIERSMLKDMDLIDTSEYVIVESAKGIDADKYKKNNVTWDTIDGRKAKIVFP